MNWKKRLDTIDTQGVFEGPEKKAEVLFSPPGPSLRSFGQEFWESICAASGAEILSRKSNRHIDAYLLSESTLLVFDERMIMLTCGQTSLVNGILALHEALRDRQISYLLYERRGMNFPEEQSSNFTADVDALKSVVEGQAMRLGGSSKEGLCLFHGGRGGIYPEPSGTLEILMSGISPRARSIFGYGEGFEPSLEAIDATGLRRLLPGFEIDEHFFQPQGYSLNAINEDLYYSIHVTPQEIGSYVSFESNYPFTSKQSEELCKCLLSTFAPLDMETVFYHRKGGRREELSSYLKRQGYQCWREESDEICHGISTTYDRFKREGSGEALFSPP